MRQCLALATFCMVMGTMAGANPAAASEEVCASSYAELEKTDRLLAFRKVLNPNQKTGFVNETSGSYFVIDAQNELKITFMTTALFDLYRIRREGPLKICDAGDSLYVDGLGKREKLVISGEQLHIGAASPRQRFHLGSAPEHLRDPESTRMPASTP